MQSTHCFFANVCRIQLGNKRFVKHFNTIIERYMSSVKHTTETTHKPLVKQSNWKPLGVPIKMRKDPALKKIDSPKFRSIFTAELRTLINIFKRHNYELRIAGGAVRDIVMGIKPKDIDLATTATPEEMKEMFTKEEVRMINDKGEKHGTITPRINNKENFEVTTLRIDVVTDGRHAQVQFTTDWQLDANRRDLTINSMFLDFDGTLYDYFYGYEDLQQRRVVFVGDPAVRIKEDYLRILRYFRFYGRIAGEPSKHDCETLKAIRDNVDGLSRVSGERIWSELQKIVIGNFGSELMQEIIGCGLAPYCGLPAEPNVNEFKRLCTDLRNFSPPHLPILYMISLLHTNEDAQKLHLRLKLSAYERDLALYITQQRQKVDIDFCVLRDLQRICFQKLVIREYLEELLKYSNKFNLYKDLKAWKIPRFPINGAILKESGVSAGVRMGAVMTELRSIWFDSNFTLSKEDLLNQHLPSVLQRYPSPPSTPPNKKP